MRDDMTDIMKKAGFVSCSWKSLSFGAAAIYIGYKNTEYKA